VQAAEVDTIVVVRRRGGEVAYYLDLFSPETYEAFARSDRSISGFRVRQRNAARRIGQGDALVCYMTRLSRWVGLLEVLEGPFVDETPIFYPEDDPFVVRFRVRPYPPRRQVGIP